MDTILKTQLEKSRYIRRGIEPDLERAAETAWLKKEALNSRLLPLAEEFDALVQHGPGVMSVSENISISGKGSICIEAPTSTLTSTSISISTSTAIKNPSDRGYETSGFTRPLDGEDITGFNRLSLRIYMDSEGFYTNFISISLNNRGEHIMPAPGKSEGSHHIALEPGKWHHVVWEIPYLYRDNVTGFTVSLNLLGALPQGADKIKMYVDDMRLETVNTEKYKGFDLAEDKIAYCHSGYKTDAVKQALIQNYSVDYFELRNEQGETVFKDNAVDLLNGFKLLDFSAFKISGKYTIYTEKIVSQPFDINEGVYLSAAWKTLNFYYLERCGADIPGVHAECCYDATCRHPDGRSLLVCGGWHDAADLTQDTANTIESAFFMLELAEAVKDKDALLYERTMEEARWVLNWVMRTRFGDGYRHTGMAGGIWTKNILGDQDDMSVVAENRPFANFAAAMLCAKAARMFKEHDSVFASWCAKCAREDFAFGCESIGAPKGEAEVKEVILYSQAAAAAVEMYKTFAGPEYMEAGAAYAEIIMQCQETDVKPDFKLPLKGYFYESREKARILTFSRRSYEHIPIQALKGLSEMAGERKDAALRRESLGLYASYIKDTADLIDPYNILPAAIYEINNADFENIYREGQKDTGAPALEEYNAQVKNGIRISDTHYLRRFPVSYRFRGFHATLLSKAKAAMLASEALNDKLLKNIAVRQVEWVLGFNPFASSGMYGERYDYHPLYVAASNQIVGALPAGFGTFENEDEPYYPMQNNCAYKEIWAHSTGRMMWLLADLL